METFVNKENDLCECGHSKYVHFTSPALDKGFCSENAGRCSCTGFKPATPQPESQNTMNEFEVRAYTNEYLVQQLEKAKIVLGMFEQEYARRHPQPILMPVSEADVERVANNLEVFCKARLLPLRSIDIKEIARYHLEQIQKYKDEQTQSLIVVDRLCVQRDELKQRMMSLEAELTAIKSKL